LTKDLQVFLNFSTLLFRVVNLSDHRRFVSDSSHDFIHTLNELPFINRKLKASNVSYKGVLRLDDLDLIRSEHYCNNVIHFFAIPAFIAKMCEENKSGKVRNLIEKVVKHMPLLTQTYFIGIPEGEFAIVVQKYIDFFKLCGYIEVSLTDDFRVAFSRGVSAWSLMIDIADHLFENKIFEIQDSINKFHTRVKVALPVKITVGTSSEPVAVNLVELSMGGGYISAPPFEAKESDLTLYLEGKGFEVQVVRVETLGFAFSFKEGSDLEVIHDILKPLVVPSGFRS
jgi:hypothetical protein